MTQLARCSECGFEVEGGSAGCRATFDELIARDFSDALYFSSHRLLVDCYCLQHPEQFCRSAKSLAAHLVGLCWILEGEAAESVGTPILRNWLDGKRELDKPALPESRGTLTIGDLPREAGPADWRMAVKRWADSIWAAYAPLHPIAREWMRRASAETRTAD